MRSKFGFGESFWRTRYSEKPPTAARPSGSMPMSRTGLVLALAAEVELEDREDFDGRRDGLDAARRPGFALILAIISSRREPGHLAGLVEDRAALVVVLDEAVHPLGVDRPCRTGRRAAGP